MTSFVTDKARWTEDSEGFWVSFKTSNKAAALSLTGIEVPHEVVVKRKGKARTKDANAMCWSICSLIADAVGTTKEAVYTRAIKDVGEYTPLPIREDAIEAFKQVWSSHGIGWPVEIVDDSKLPGYKLVFAYHGSSVYDTKTMGRLIDYLVDEAKNLGLDTISERERSLLLSEWGNK